MTDIKTYKMFASVTAATDGAASYDVQEDGKICAVLVDINVTGADALNDGGNCELSFASVSSFNTNDVRASILGVGVFQGFLTSGGGPTSKNAFITFSPNGIPVAAGERIFLHISVGGTVTAVAVRAWLYHGVEEQSGRAGVTRRAR